MEISLRNPHAKADLKLRIVIASNTAPTRQLENARINAASDLEWLGLAEPHGRPMAIIGGGPSVADHLRAIRTFQDAGAMVMALNGASTYLRSRGIVPDVQFVLDSQPETASLVDPMAKAHIFASQVDPMTVAAVPAPTLVHLMTEGLPEVLQKVRPGKSGYMLIGGSVSSGNSATCLAYGLGYRSMHLFGMDSSHRGDEGHAYPQPMNAGIMCVSTEIAGQVYISSIAMKAQAEAFLWLIPALEAAGCDITVHGNGLLPALLERQANGDV